MRRHNTYIRVRTPDLTRSQKPKTKNSYQPNRSQREALLRIWKRCDPDSQHNRLRRSPQQRLARHHSLWPPLAYRRHAFFVQHRNTVRPRHARNDDPANEPGIGGRTVLCNTAVPARRHHALAPLGRLHPWGPQHSHILAPEALLDLATTTTSSLLIDTQISSGLNKKPSSFRCCFHFVGI